MHPTYKNACASCAHLLTSGPGGRITCTAYPHGVPQLIINGTLDHTQSVEGDSGILWELDPESELEYFQYLQWKTEQEQVSGQNG